MVDVDKILELKRRIMQIAKEIDAIREVEIKSDDPDDALCLDEAYCCLDQADDLLGELT